jgi:hypothetical protein
MANGLTAKPPSTPKLKRLGCAFYVMMIDDKKR